MPLPQMKHYTYADLLEWPTDERHELYQGQPVLLSAPSRKHQDASMSLSVQIGTFLKGKPCRAYAAPTDLRLFEGASDTPESVDTVLQPDLMVVCDSNKIDDRGVKGAPTIVIEILSPSSQREDRIVKYSMYERAGVQEYWIVDPDLNQVQVLSLSEGKYYLGRSYTTGEFTSSAVDGLTINVDDIFA